MRPGRDAGEPRKLACCSKAARGCPAMQPICKKARRGTEKAAGNMPGGFLARRSSGRKKPVVGASAVVVGAALPEEAVATAGPASHAEQLAEAALLAVIEALVERLGGIGELPETCRARSHG